MVATIISVAVMIVTLSLANGFQEAVSQKVFSFWGHIRIQEKQPGKAIISEETPIYKNDSLITSILQNPEVKSIHPFATRYAILKTPEDIEGILVKVSIALTILRTCSNSSGKGGLSVLQTALSAGKSLFQNTQPPA